MPILVLGNTDANTVALPVPQLRLLPFPPTSVTFTSTCHLTTMHLAVTGYATTDAATANQFATMPNLALAVTRWMPRCAAGDQVELTAAGLTFTRCAPSVNITERQFSLMATGALQITGNEYHILQSDNSVTQVVTHFGLCAHAPTFSTDRRYCVLDANALSVRCFAPHLSRTDSRVVVLPSSKLVQIWGHVPSTFFHNLYDVDIPKLSAIFPEQPPEFIRSQHPNFVQFLVDYFKWMERAGEAYNLTKNLLDFQDVDNSIDQYLAYLKQEFLVDFPHTSSVHVRTLIKNIRQWYRARGTEKSFEFFFRALLHTEVRFYYPGRDMLRTSDGKWMHKYAMRVLALSGDPLQLAECTVTGAKSGASAMVERVVRKQLGVLDFYELELNKSSIRGVFRARELISGPGGAPEMQALVGVQTVRLTQPGTGHSVGDRVDVTGNGGFGARLKVSAVGPNGEIKGLQLMDPGVDYGGPLA